MRNVGYNDVNREYIITTDDPVVAEDIRLRSESETEAEKMIEKMTEKINSKNALFELTPMPYGHNKA